MVEPTEHYSRLLFNTSDFCLFWVIYFSARVFPYSAHTHTYTVYIVKFLFNCTNPVVLWFCVVRNVQTLAQFSHKKAHFGIRSASSGWQSQFISLPPITWNVDFGIFFFLDTCIIPSVNWEQELCWYPNSTTQKWSLPYCLYSWELKGTLHTVL